MAKKELSKIDYSYKSFILNNHADLLKEQRVAHRKDYVYQNFVAYGVVSPILRDITSSDSEFGASNLSKIKCDALGLNRELKECVRINKAYFNRVSRLKDRVKSMLLNGSCSFLTLTFTNDTLAKTDYLKRRVFVSRYLKSQNAPYIANIDFGAKNGREHYHAIIQSKNIDLSAWRKFGNINVEVIRNTNIEQDSVKLGKYISKLTNHAIKETTKRSCLIYSR